MFIFPFHNMILKHSFWSSDRYFQSWLKLLISYETSCHPWIRFVLSLHDKRDDQSKAIIITSRRSYGTQNTSKVCNNCGKAGHTIDTCYRKQGFPPQFKFKN